MLRVVVGALTLVLLVAFTDIQAQEKLASKGWGTLTGKVTLDGDVPAIVSLKARMMLHADKACCLDGKAVTDDETWVVDPKTKGVANVMVYLKAPAGLYFPTHPKMAKRPGAVIDQPFCSFIPRMSGYNPVHYNDKGMLVETGQKVLIKNSAVVSHNVRAIGNVKLGNPGFNENLPAKTETTKSFKPQPLPIQIQCDVHTWMKAQLFVFDHPYYAVTNKDGVFEIPFVPAGAELGVAAYHEDIGYLLGKDGQKMTLKEGKNTFDFQIKK